MYVCALAHGHVCVFADEDTSAAVKGPLSVTMFPCFYVGPGVWTRVARWCSLSSISHLRTQCFQYVEMHSMRINTKKLSSFQILLYFRSMKMKKKPFFKLSIPLVLPLYRVTPWPMLVHIFLSELNPFRVFDRHNWFQHTSQCFSGRNFYYFYGILSQQC